MCLVSIFSKKIWVLVYYFRATPTILQIVFDKCCYLPTPKTIWGGNRKDISKCLVILALQKQNSTSSKDQRRNIKLSVCYKSTRMQNAKPILGVHKYQERRRICQLSYKCQTQLPNCWIGDFESFGKKQKCQTYLQNCWSCSYKMELNTMQIFGKKIVILHFRFLALKGKKKTQNEPQETS